MTDFKHYFGEHPLISEDTIWRINKENQFLMFNTITPNDSKQTGIRLTEKGSNLFISFDFTLIEQDGKLYFIDSSNLKYKIVINPLDVNNWKMVSAQGDINLSREYLIKQGIV